MFNKQLKITLHQQFYQSYDVLNPCMTLLTLHYQTVSTLALVFSLFAAVCRCSDCTTFSVTSGRSIPS